MFYCLVVIHVAAFVSGMTSVAMSFVMMNLGDLYVIISNLHASLIAPIAGIFLAGMFLPWANSKVSAVIKLVHGTFLQ